MNDIEKEHLQHIYKARCKLFFPVFAILLAYAIYCSFGGYYRDIDDKYDYQVFGHELNNTELFIIMLIFLPGLISVCGIVIYLKKIHTYKKDVLLGMKEEVSYAIVRKQYFPRTNQYFLSFDDPKYMHYEVDALVYNAYNIGDTFPIYRGVYSKQVFEKNGRYTLM